MESNFQSPVSTSSEGKPKINVVFLVLIFGLLLVLLYVFGTSWKKEGGKSLLTEDRVEVTQTDLASAQGSDRVPAGMPSDIPAPREEDTVVESHSMYYADKGLTQYTLTFETARPYSETFDTYAEYITQAGYELHGGNNSENRRSLFGIRGGDDFSVVVGVQNAGSYVQISYLDR